ncbi:MAG TPA: carboxypeptidase-like regulatory domain-containing protein, partial [Chitinophagaceae bacterium]|nr:carboxypeptidase-like regulatory domain-containing protein [Chitinophagaceae bacterium]
MRTLVLLFCFAVFALPVLAQDISGTVTDEQGKPLGGVSVTLKKSKDSVVVKLAASNATGNYTFKSIPEGSYFVAVSHVGYADQRSNSFTLQGNGAEVPAFSLKKASGNLKEVVVSTRKPLIEVRAEKTILNIEGSVNAVGQNALELL